MKLYTEEQVRKAIELSLLNAKLFIHKGLGDDKYFPTVYEALKNLTPIELPSEISDNVLFEQAKVAMEEIYGSGCSEEIDAYFRGLKWMQKQYNK